MKRRQNLISLNPTENSRYLEATNNAGTGAYTDSSGLLLVRQQALRSPCFLSNIRELCQRDEMPTRSSKDFTDALLLPRALTLVILVFGTSGCPIRGLPNLGLQVDLSQPKACLCD